MSSPPLRPFRFGVSAWRAWEPDGWRSLAREVDASAFSTLLLADHLVDGAPPPLLSLATAVELTDRIHVGTFVLNNDFHHPADLARQAATLDLISSGRFELGLGAGHMKSEYDEVGLGAGKDRALARVEAEDLRGIRG